MPRRNRDAMFSSRRVSRVVAEVEVKQRPRMRRARGNQRRYCRQRVLVRFCLSAVPGEVSAAAKTASGIAASHVGPRCCASRPAYHGIAALLCLSHHPRVYAIARYRRRPRARLSRYFSRECVRHRRFTSEMQQEGRHQRPRVLSAKSTGKCASRQRATALR